MKLAEKLAAMSNEQQTMEETVTNEIINFFVDKFKNGEMMEAFEKKLSDTILHNRKVDVYVDFWTYIPGCSETYFGLLDKEWKPEDDHGYEHKGVNLKNIYKDVLAGIIEVARENFENEGFKVDVRPNEKNHRYNTYIIEISW